MAEWRRPAPEQQHDHRLISGAASKLINGAMGSNALTIEAWVKPANVTQDGPARMVSISADTNNRNVTLGQGLWGAQAADLYNVRLRTTTNILNGSGLRPAPSDSPNPN